MSKLLDEVKSQMTGNRKYIITPMVSVQTGIEEFHIPDYAYEYEIKATFGARVHCQKRDLQRVQDNIIRQLKDDMYGHLRRRMMQLEISLYGQCMLDDEARGIINDIKVEIS